MNNNIDLTLLKNYQSSLESEIRLFDTSCYNLFMNGYINSCSDPYIKVAASKLDILYKKIIDDYSAINKWWVNYLENISALENCLCDNIGIGYISEGNVRNYVQRNLLNLNGNKQILFENNINKTNVVDDSPDFVEF